MLRHDTAVETMMFSHNAAAEADTVALHVLRQCLVSEKVMKRDLRTLLKQIRETQRVKITNLSGNQIVTVFSVVAASALSHLNLNTISRLAMNLGLAGE